MTRAAEPTPRREIEASQAKRSVVQPVSNAKSSCGERKGLVRAGQPPHRSGPPLDRASAARKVGPVVRSSASNNRPHRSNSARSEPTNEGGEDRRDAVRPVCESSCRAPSTDATAQLKHMTCPLRGYLNHSWMPPGRFSVHRKEATRRSTEGKHRCTLVVRVARHRFGARSSVGLESPLDQRTADRNPTQSLPLWYRCT